MHKPIIKVPLPDKKIVFTKPTQSGIIYVRYLVSSKRVSNTNVNQKRVNIGIYDKEENKLIPNDNYFKYFNTPIESFYIPKKTRNYGAYYLLYKVASSIHLWDTVKEIFKKDWDKIMTLVMYMLIECEPMLYIDYFCDESFTPNEIFIRSESVTSIFSSITEEKRMEFFKEWINVNKTNECIAYDVTSISTYGKDISTADYGYNRDDEDLPQINLGMFYGQTTKLPLLYETYNGAITDKVHFEAMMKYAKSYNINNVSFVLDNGFFTKDNLKYLYNNNIPFIMKISVSSNIVSEKIQELKNRIQSSRYKTNYELINGKTSIVNIDKNIYKLHLFYNENKKVDELSILYDKIDKLEEQLQKIKEMLDSKKYRKYFNITINEDNSFTYEKDYDKIDNIRNELGYFAIISSRFDNDINDILKIYRNKDSIEKVFDNLKNYLDTDRLRVHKDSSLSGKMFITFLSLILKAQIDEKINNEKVTTKMVLKEVDKIKLQVLMNDNSYIAPLTKKQKEIFSKFNITEDEVKESVNQLHI